MFSHFFLSVWREFSSHIQGCLTLSCLRAWMLRTGENLLSSWCLWFLPVLGSNNCVPSAPQQGEKLETNSCCSWHGQTRYFPKSLSVQHQERGWDWRASVALSWSIHIPIFKFCSHLSFYPICKCETATTTTLQNIIDIYCVVRDSSWQQYQHFFPFFPTRKKWERCRVTTWLPIWCREDFLGGLLLPWEFPGGSWKSDQSPALSLLCPQILGQFVLSLLLCKKRILWGERPSEMPGMCSQTLLSGH